MWADFWQWRSDITQQKNGKIDNNRTTITTATNINISKSKIYLLQEENQGRWAWAALVDRNIFHHVSVARTKLLTFPLFHIHLSFSLSLFRFYISATSLYLISFYLSLDISLLISHPTIYLFSLSVKYLFLFLSLCLFNLHSFSLFRSPLFIFVSLFFIF